MKAKRHIIKSRLVLYDHGRILLLKQTKPKGGNYTLVGGTVEKHELPRETLVRESMEEAGLLLEEKNLQLVHVLHKNKNEKVRITLYFKALKWSGELKAREQEKFKSAEWFALDDLPKNLTNSAAIALKSYRKGILFSEFREDGKENSIPQEPWEI